MDKVLLYKALAKNGAEKSASGNPVVLTDTIEGKSLKDLKLYGWSKQESTTGANLIDIDSMLNECLVKNDDGTYSILKTETDRFSKRFPVNLTAGTVVRLDANIIEYNGTYGSHLRINFSNWQSIRENETLILKSDVKEAEIYQHKENDVGTYTKFKNAMLSIGEEKIPYEPYTGGKPSPSPEYTQEIISAGQAGVGDTGIRVKITGKNLVDIYGYSANDISNPDDIREASNHYGTTIGTTEKKDKLVVNQKINEGAKPNSYTSGYFCIGINERLEEGKVYKVSFDMEVLSNPFGVSNIGMLINGINYTTAKITEKRVATTALYEAYNKRQYVEIRNNGMSLEISNFMITEEDENTIYEPYHEPQTISINTKTGLPAVPVTTGGNYTDANGQQWIADYVDLKRGKYVQNVKEFPVSDNMTISTWGVNANADNVTGFYAYVKSNNLPIPGSEAMMSTIIKYRKEVWGGITIGCSMNCNNDSYAMLCIRTDALEDTTTDANAVKSFLTLCEKTDAHFYYVLADPIERDLTPEEIQAYKNLVTYTGTTIVGNDAECYMEVTAGGANVLRAKKIAMLLGE